MRRGYRDNHPLYRTYLGMIHRCHNPKNKSYFKYGARGIEVCERWKGKIGFDKFLEDMGSKPEPSYSIERIDNDGNYEPSNCRWASKSEQSYNQRIGSRNKTGVKGVSYDSRDKSYRAYITINKQTMRLGWFKTLQEAAGIRKTAELNMCGKDDHEQG